MSLLWTHAIAMSRDYFHGTNQDFAPGDHILPAAEHGGEVSWPNMTDRNHAYATEDEGDAWNWAHKGWEMRGGGPENRPRVYRVRPAHPVEQDPQRDEHGYSRDVSESDKRSPHGFQVVEEMERPTEDDYDFGGRMEGKSWYEGVGYEDEDYRERFQPHMHFRPGYQGTR